MFKLELVESEKIIDVRSRFNHSSGASPTSPLVFLYVKIWRRKNGVEVKILFQMKTLPQVNVHSNQGKARHLHGAAVNVCHYFVPLVYVRHSACFISLFDASLLLS